MKKSIESSEGESFNLVNDFEISDNVEMWMTKVEDEMKQSLCIITKDMIFWCGKQDWIELIASSKSLGMSSISGSQIWWTWEVEYSFCSVKAGESHAILLLDKKLNKQLKDMVEMIHSPLDELTRKKVNTLLIIDVHAWDIVANFVRMSIVNINQFECESQLRFYWNMDEDDCIIKQCNGLFHYWFEDIGFNRHLLITPLTDRYYMILTQAVKL